MPALNTAGMPKLWSVDLVRTRAGILTPPHVSYLAQTPKLAPVIVDSAEWVEEAAVTICSS